MARSEHARYAGRERNLSDRVLKRAAERAFNRMEYDTNGGCWLWSGALNCGYGVLGINHRPTLRIDWSMPLVAEKFRQGCWFAIGAMFEPASAPTTYSLGIMRRIHRIALRRGGSISSRTEADTTAHPIRMRSLRGNRFKKFVLSA